MKLEFKNLDLETSEAEFNGRKIQIRKNLDGDQTIWVDEVITSAGPFANKKEAIAHVEKIVDKILSRMTPAPAKQGQFSPPPKPPPVLQKKKKSFKPRPVISNFKPNPAKS